MNAKKTTPRPVLPGGLRRRHWLAAGGAAWLAATARASARPLARGDTVAWPSVALLDGTRWGPAQASGHAVVLLRWSITCAFCHRHNPRIEALHRAALAEGRALRVVAASIDRDADAVRRHAAARGYTFPITLEADALVGPFSARRITPLTCTVDRQGRRVEVIPGEMAEADVMALLAQLAPD